MTHDQLINELAVRLNWTNEKVNETLKTGVEIICDNVSDGNVVSIQDFGSLELKKISEHIYVDNETSERYLVPPKLDVSFSISSTFKERFIKIKHI